MEISSLNHKTVFVLDHSAAFLEPSAETVDVDVGNRRKNVASGCPVTKTMWTLCVEAVVEYCRVVFDLFGLSKLFSLITSDTEGKVLTVWLDEDQTLEQLLSVLREEGPPRPVSAGQSSEMSVMHGVVQAAKVLSIPSPRQKDEVVRGRSVENRGRVIIISTGLDRDSAKSIVESAAANFAGLTIDEGCVSIKEVELYLINLRQPRCEERIPEKDLTWLNDQTRAAIIDVPADMSFVRKMLRMCQQHFDLASTTVCDIPMKEEAPGGAGSQGNNKNYKVELLHASEAHLDMQRSNGFENARRELPRSGFSSSLPLKWLTPKNPSGKTELHNCSGTFRITTADVCNRASTCLVTFLLGGRAVMLEQRTGEDGSGAQTTHMLASHGGDLFMHTLAYHRNPLDEPTTITECIGGKCTDYRIQDFTSLMDTARLAPTSERMVQDTDPIERCFSHLERQTRYWPMAISESFMLQESMSTLLGPLLTALPKVYLTEEEIEACKKCILELLGMEARCGSLPLTTTRNKGVKRQEQFRVLFTELEYFLARFTDLSATHKKLLAWYLQTAGRRINTGDPRPDAERPTGLRLLDERLREAKAGTKEIKPEASNSGEPPEKKWKFDNGQQLKKSGVSLLAMIAQRNRMKVPVRQDFAGRLEAAAMGRTQADLYQHLHQKELSKDLS